MESHLVQEFRHIRGRIFCRHHDTGFLCFNTAWTCRRQTTNFLMTSTGVLHVSDWSRDTTRYGSKYVHTPTEINFDRHSVTGCKEYTCSHKGICAVIPVLMCLGTATLEVWVHDFATIVSFKGVSDFALRDHIIPAKSG
jgi:hypothetical protein